MKINLRVWWNSNFGHKPFHKQVNSIQEAKDVLQLLTDYDLYLGDKIVGNAGGLEILQDDEYIEFCDDDDRTILEIMDSEKK